MSTEYLFQCLSCDHEFHAMYDVNGKCPNCGRGYYWDFDGDYGPDSVYSIQWEKVKTMWTDYFSKIYLINLPDRKEKLQLSREQLDRYNIPFEVVHPVHNYDGASSLFHTMMCLLRTIKPGDNILVFEDDVKFINDPGSIMPGCIEGLKELDWDLFHLGPNTHQPFMKPVKPGILKLFNAFSTHAVAYSAAGIKKITERFVWTGVPIDVMLATQVQGDGHSYCSYPMIATQRNGYSDIEKKEVTYDYIEQRFKQHTNDIGRW